MNPRDQGGVCLGGIWSAHRAQHTVAPVLQGPMEVRRKAWRVRDDVNDLWRAVHRFQRADAKQHVCPHTGQHAQEFSQ